MNDKIEIKGAREHNLKKCGYFYSEKQTDSCNRFVRFGEIRLWHLTRFMPRGSAVMWRACLLMPANFWNL